MLASILTPLETALASFAQRDLRTAATELLKTLGYESRRVMRLDNPTAEQGNCINYQVGLRDF